MDSKAYLEATKLLDSDDILLSLHYLTMVTKSAKREVFLSDKGYGYVWCFPYLDSFDESLLVRIDGGRCFYFSDIKEREDSDEIIMDLRKAYEENPVEFQSIRVINKFEHSVDKYEVPFPNPKESFWIELALTNREKMVEALEDVTRKYNILEPDRV